jgi:hypothetical protein
MKLLLIALLAFPLMARGENLIYGFAGIQIPKQQMRFTTFDDANNKLQEFLLDPNPKRNLTIAAHFKKFSLFLGLPIIGEDPKASGKSKSIDFRFKSKFKRFLPRVYFQKYRGFELRDERNNSSKLGFLYDVKTLNYGLGLRTYLKEEFISYHSGFVFFDKVKNSKVASYTSNKSYLFNVGYNYLKIEGLPDTNIAFKPLSGESRISTSSINFGGTYQGFYRSLFLEGTLALGPGYASYKDQNGVDYGKLVFNGDVELLVGANFSENYFFLTHLDLQFISGKLKGTELNNSLISLDISLGYSF